MAWKDIKCTSAGRRPVILDTRAIVTALCWPRLASQRAGSSSACGLRGLQKFAITGGICTVGLGSRPRLAAPMGVVPVDSLPGEVLVLADDAAVVVSTLVLGSLFSLLGAPTHAQRKKPHDTATPSSSPTSITAAAPPAAADSASAATPTGGCIGGSQLSRGGSSSTPPPTQYTSGPLTPPIVPIECYNTCWSSSDSSGANNSSSYGDFKGYTNANSSETCNLATEGEKNEASAFDLDPPLSKTDCSGEDSDKRIYRCDEGSGRGGCSRYAVSSEERLFDTDRHLPGGQQREGGRSVGWTSFRGGRDELHTAGCHDGSEQCGTGNDDRGDSSCGNRDGTLNEDAGSGGGGHPSGDNRGNETSAESRGGTGSYPFGGVGRGHGRGGGGGGGGRGWLAFSAGGSDEDGHGRPPTAIVWNVYLPIAAVAAVALLLSWRANLLPEGQELNPSQDHRRRLFPVNYSLQSLSVQPEQPLGESAAFGQQQLQGQQPGQKGGQKALEQQRQEQHPVNQRDASALLAAVVQPQEADCMEAGIVSAGPTASTAAGAGRRVYCCGAWGSGSAGASADFLKRNLFISHSRSIDVGVRVGIAMAAAAARSHPWPAAYLTSHPQDHIASGSIFPAAAAPSWRHTQPPKHATSASMCIPMQHQGCGTWGSPGPYHFGLFHMPHASNARKLQQEQQQQPQRTPNSVTVLAVLLQLQGVPQVQGALQPPRSYGYLSDTANGDANNERYSPEQFATRPWQPDTRGECARGYDKQQDASGRSQQVRLVRMRTRPDVARQEHRPPPPPTPTTKRQRKPGAAQFIKWEETTHHHGREPPSTQQTLVPALMEAVTVVAVATPRVDGAATAPITPTMAVAPPTIATGVHSMRSPPHDVDAPEDTPAAGQRRPAPVKRVPFPHGSHIVGASSPPCISLKDDIKTLEAVEMGLEASRRRAEQWLAARASSRMSSSTITPTSSALLSA